MQNLGRLVYTPMAFVQGGIFIVSHQLWHGALFLVVSSEGNPPPSLVTLYDKRTKDQLLLRKGRGPSFEQTWVLITQGCFMPSLVEISPVVLVKTMKMWKVSDNDNRKILIRKAQPPPPRDEFHDLRTVLCGVIKVYTNACGYV